MVIQLHTKKVRATPGWYPSCRPHGICHCSCLLSAGSPPTAVFYRPQWGLLSLLSFVRHILLPDSLTPLYVASGLLFRPDQCGQSTNTTCSRLPNLTIYAPLATLNESLPLDTVVKTSLPFASRICMWSPSVASTTMRPFST